MISRLVVIVGCWAGVLTIVVAAQPSDWTGVVALPSGVSVRVESSAGRVQSGRFVRADSDHLTITAAGRPVQIPRADVRRLYRISERHVGRYAMLGLGIGAAAGATLGALAAETNKAPWSALMALGWGTVGATIGAVNGLHHDRVLLYEVQTSTSN